MHLVRRFHRMPKVATTIRTHSSSKTEKSVHIEIPNRIQRSPTDILYALAGTVGRDRTAPHYKYHDDPYLIPLSNVGKRTFAVAQEAGRRAAKWIRDNHSDVFMHQEAEPSISAFAPKVVFTEETEVDEKSLRQVILQGEVNDAVFVYNLMKQNKVEINPELRQSLLELVCFYNNEEPLAEEFIEERWFKENQASRERSRKTWKDGDVAEQLFAEIEPKTPASYAALIRGMAKYYQAERANALLQDSIAKQYKLDTATFNAVLSIANFLNETADQRWSLCQDLLNQMAQQELKPDIGTLNATLECVSSFGNFKFARSCALKTLAEFKSLGIEPSLGTYYYLLIIFCRDRAPVSHIIVDILHELEGRALQIVHTKDTFFFTTAMDVCRYHLHDKSLAKKVNALLHTGSNYDLIGDSYKESIYYRHYFALLCQMETIEEFMETYNLLVPNVYIPEPGIMEEILKAVEMNGAIELVPRLWSDMVIFDHIGRESLITRTLQIMLNAKPRLDDPIQSELPSQYAKIASDIYTKISDPEGRSKVAFTGQMIGDILTLLVRGENYEKAVEVFTYIDKKQHHIPGTPSVECLAEFIGCCIVNKAPSQAIACLEYACENQMDSTTLAQQIHERFTLNEVHLSKIKSLVGERVLEK